LVQHPWKKNVMSASFTGRIQRTVTGWKGAVDQAISACGRANMRSTIRALIVANEYLETEVSELMKEGRSPRLCARQISQLLRLIGAARGEGRPGEPPSGPLPSS